MTTKDYIDNQKMAFADVREQEFRRLAENAKKGLEVEIKDFDKFNIDFKVVKFPDLSINVFFGLNLIAVVSANSKTFDIYDVIEKAEESMRLIVALIRAFINHFTILL
jgi:hypothetical protein